MGFFYIFLMMEYKKPELLKPGDQVAIVAVSKKVAFNEVEPAIKILESWGLKVLLSKNHWFSSQDIFAGTDQERLENLQIMIDDKKIKAIFCSRGGYGATRIIDEVNFKPLSDYPKWIIGFSDITVLLNHTLTENVESIHGPLAFQFKDKNYASSIEYLKRLLFEAEYSVSVKSHPLDIFGTANATIAGGNLTMLINMLGTKSEPDFSGKIFLLEEVEEYLYKVDRMMVHLKRAGKLRNLAGAIVGHMTNMLDNDIPFGKSVYEIIHEHLSGLNIPVCFGFPSGHEPENVALPFGRKAHFEVSPKGTRLEFDS